MSRKILPDITTIKFLKPSEALQIALGFMRYSFPNKLQLFSINSLEEHPIAFEPFLKPLIAVSKFVQRELWIGRYTIEITDFATILQCFAHIEQITFHNWKLFNFESEMHFDETIDYKIK